MTDDPGPDYQRVYDDIWHKIRSGEYAIGAPIPSTTKLAAQYGVSPQPVRTAVRQLQLDGILRGHHGKAVYVKAMPAAAEAEQRDLRAIGEDVAELARRVAGNDELREIVNRIESNLIELYGKTGFTYPADAGDGERERTAHHG